MTDLPRWVWDILADVIEYEAGHAKGHPCLESTFVRIPADYMQCASAIAAYRRIPNAEVIEEKS